MIFEILNTNCLYPNPEPPFKGIGFGNSVPIECEEIEAEYTWKHKVNNVGPELETITEKTKKYIREFNTAEDLVNFSKEVGYPIIITSNEDCYYLPRYPLIEIYDSWRE